ncbi:hypothetical protein [Vibrio splendidus]|uniref:Uncharacterized protein n=1 Tax=Vibrio splendidus TaxID=29497 RepID=A0A7Y4D931_VIBSP|nr:hypothetical protein [Vibrio splendidus]NOJ14006.1 hypothetical protein [Vibrio splendidus]
MSKSKSVMISDLKLEDVILPETKSDTEKETQTTIVQGTSIVRDGDNPIQLAFSPTAVFNAAFKSNLADHDNKQAVVDARRAILSIDDKNKVKGKVVAPSAMKLAFELLETEESPERRNEIAFGLDTMLALQNQPFIRDEVQYTSQQRLEKMPNEKRKFKKQEQAKGVDGDHVHHVIPVSEDPSKCSSPENFKLMPNQEHVEHHQQEQKEAKSYIDGEDN